MRDRLFCVIVMGIAAVGMNGGCTGGGGCAAEPWSRYHASPEERDSRAQKAYWDVPKPFRGEYPSEANRREREQGNVLGW